MHLAASIEKNNQLNAVISRKVTAMNYLSEEIRCSVNGKETRLAILVEDGHIIFFNQSDKNDAFNNILDGNLIKAGMENVLKGGLVKGALRLATVPFALGGKAIDAIMNKRKTPDLFETVNKIKVEYKISEDKIFISDPENCSVKLSEKYPGKVVLEIEGDFIAGETKNKFNIETKSRLLPGNVEETFTKGDFPVTYI